MSEGMRMNNWVCFRDGDRWSVAVPLFSLPTSSPFSAGPVAERFTSLAAAIQWMKRTPPRLSASARSQRSLFSLGVGCSMKTHRCRECKAPMSRYDYCENGGLCFSCFRDFWDLGTGKAANYRTDVDRVVSGLPVRGVVPARAS